MIANERQYKIARQQLARLRESLEELEARETSASLTLRQAEVGALRSQIESVEAEIEDYEALRSGAMRIPTDVGLAALPHLLIRARISLGLSQRDLAKRAGLKEQQIQRYESQEYASASLNRLRKIADALGLKVSDAPGESSASGEAQTNDEVLDWKRFPVREMYRRGWFPSFSGSLSEAVRGADVLVRDFVENAMKHPVAALHRQRVRASGEYNKYGLLAWQCRILTLAAAQDTARYMASSMSHEWFHALAKQSRAADGPKRARTHLAEIGIALIIEPHIAGTFLDGAALLQRSRPVIGMTLRYDRLDNFWFVLFHELAHVKWHLRRGVVEAVFDDLDSEVADEIEREADTRAGDILIEEESWKKAVVRYTRSPAAVEAFAKEMGISPAIVAGRIRHEARNYVILTELVGQGEARRHFPEVLFGA